MNGIKHRARGAGKRNEQRLAEVVTRVIDETRIEHIVTVVNAEQLRDEIVAALVKAGAFIPDMKSGGGEVTRGGVVDGEPPTGGSGVTPSSGGGIIIESGAIVINPGVPSAAELVRRANIETGRQIGRNVSRYFR